MANSANNEQQVPSAAERRAHIEALRERKRTEAEAIGVDAEYISSFVERFYGKIRKDELLGPIFAERIGDWAKHLDRMKGFWRSVLHASGEFAGNPMIKHIAIPGLEERHFAHWLQLFYATLREEEPQTEATQEVANRARMIADSLLTGIATQRKGLAGARAGEKLPKL
ncbi:group III truncated hemoglobin [Altererythrobacter sp. Root672]|uniref:group III truncated hemoglobin n=1 Tax=Altererythrobacter sp. Root672 TaxID=1736584 RepID=UPI000B2C0A85|nr:group III truncated hemoglobin [Altererythrobacter sp. Root672]